MPKPFGLPKISKQLLSNLVLSIDNIKSIFKFLMQILIYLKGVGNFGIFSPTMLKVLETCIKTNDKIEVRVAVLESFRLVIKNL